MTEFGNDSPFLKFLLVVLSLLLATASTAFAIDLEYNITIDNPNSRQANSKMIINNVSGDLFAVRDISGPSGYGINVISLNATDNEGNSLDVVHTSGDKTLWEPDIWMISCTGLSIIKIEYVIEPTKVTDPTHGGSTYWGYVSNDYAVLQGAYLFLVPADASSIDSMKIKFNIPEEWEIVTPWLQNNEIYDPLSIETPDFYSIFGSSVLGLGHFDIFTKIIGTAEVTVAAYKYWPDANRQDLSQKAWDIFSYQASVWGDSLDKPYVAIFHPHADDGQPIQNSAGPLGTIYDLGTDGLTAGSNWFAFAIELIETRYTAYDWGIADNDHCTWFKAGGGNFYGLKSILKTYIEKGSETHILDQYDSYIQYYVNQGKDIPLASLDSNTPENDEHDMARTKGTLAVYLIAKEIYTRTDGAFNLDDLSKLLFERYWGTGNRIIEEDVKSAMTDLTGIDFTEFFDDYFYGTKVFPMEWASIDDDGDGLSNVGEICWDTDPNNSDTDNDGYSDSVEIEAHTDPTDRRSCPGECPPIAMPWIPLLLLDE